MNIISSRIIISMIMISLLASCTQPQKQEETPKIPVIKYSSGESTEASSLDAKKKKDIQAFQDAMNAPNFSACEKETNPSIKDQCRDDAIYSKATMSKDASVCNTIKNAETLGMCTVSSMKIGSGTELENPCTSLTEEKAKKSCEGAFTTMQATRKNDSLLCDAIEDSLKKNSCIMNVIVTEVIKKKNIALCTKIPDIEGRKSCFSIQFGDIKTK